MAGAEGLEPSNDGTKTRCLTDLATPQRDKGFVEETLQYVTVCSHAFFPKVFRNRTCVRIPEKSEQ